MSDKNMKGGTRAMKERLANNVMRTLPKEGDGLSSEDLTKRIYGELKPIPGRKMAVDRNQQAVINMLFELRNRGVVSTRDGLWWAR